MIITSLPMPLPPGLYVESGSQIPRLEVVVAVVRTVVVVV